MEVVDVHGTPHRAVEAGHQRRLATVFGEVGVARLAYRRRGHPNLHPADAVLNLPAERHSHGLRRLAALEAARGSFDGTVEAIGRCTGQPLGKRQAEQLAARAAVDFDDFYAGRAPPTAGPDDVLVLSCDGKGIVMRPDALRAATAKAAAEGATKLSTRLSKGEKRNRKRMATVASVYDLTPVRRTPADILPAAGDDADQATPAPTAQGKWLMASVIADAATLVEAMFDEAERRDPDHQRSWVALVDGNNHQIQRINAEARERGIDVTIVIDFVHVLEYLWRAAWSFFDEADPAETWVREKASAVLAGHATRVAAAIRRKATYHRQDPTQRAPAHAGASKAQKPSSDCEPYTATATSTPTGATTSPKRSNETTNSATPTTSSPKPPDVPSEEPHPDDFGDTSAMTDDGHLLIPGFEAPNHVEQLRPQFRDGHFAHIGIIM